MQLRPHLIGPNPESTWLHDLLSSMGSENGTNMLDLAEEGAGAFAADGQHALVFARPSAGWREEPAVRDLEVRCEPPHRALFRLLTDSVATIWSGFC